ncbi:thioesterase family protein [Actinomadura sp. NPDC047616]|uniref:thioesterase family protein n=1 Tax=Actinomadura sp. NPDC047616 TaxID=3155914 RepID=UPI0033F5E064
MDTPPAETFYEPLDEDRFASTPATAGPWSPGFQHGGPVSALLGRAFQRHDPVPGTRIARVTVEILAPVPVAPLRVTVRTVRPGRRVSLLEGELFHEERPVARATGWRIAAAPDHVEPTDHAPAPPPLPATGQAVTAWPGAYMDGYLSAMEWRYTEGSFTGRGPGRTWARPRVPLVTGEADTPLVRALVLADSASGVGAQLDFAKLLVINTDVTVALHRDPVGEWICMDARVHASPHGSALAQASLADPSGEFGHVLQTLLVDEHRP